MNKLTVLCVAVLGLVAIAGCGGDDDGEVATGDVTKQEYIAEANNVCGEGDARLDKAAEAYFVDELGLKGNEQPSQEQIETFAEDEVIPEIQDQIDALRDLEAPEADADQLTEIYDTAQAALDEAEDDPSVLASQDSDLFAETNRLLDDYGITECAD